MSENSYSVQDAIDSGKFNLLFGHYARVYDYESVKNLSSSRLLVEAVKRCFELESHNPLLALADASLVWDSLSVSEFQALIGLVIGGKHPNILVMQVGDSAALFLMRSPVHKAFDKLASKILTKLYELDAA